MKRIRMHVWQSDRWKKMKTTKKKGVLKAEPSRLRPVTDLNKTSVILITITSSITITTNIIIAIVITIITITTITTNIIFVNKNY